MEFFWRVQCLDLPGVFGDPLIVFGVIGGDVEAAAILELGVEFSEERCLDEPAFVVSFFWPGVWKIDVDLAKRCVGHVIADKRAGFGTHQADIVQSAAAAPVGPVAPERFGVFQADVVGVWGLLGLADQKCSLTRSDFQLDRVLLPIGAKPATQIDGPIID